MGGGGGGMAAYISVQFYCSIRGCNPTVVCLIPIIIPNYSFGSCLKSEPYRGVEFVIDGKGGGVMDKGINRRRRYVSH